MLIRYGHTHSHSEVALTRSISDFVQDARELRELERAKEASKRGQYWLGLPPPKACADVVESLVAAVVVDSGFELAAGQELFDRM